MNSTAQTPEAESPLEYAGKRLATLSRSSLSLLKHDVTENYNRAVIAVRKNGWSGGRAEYRDALEALAALIDDELRRRDVLAEVRS
jgi:hypothetical protein